MRKALAFHVLQHVPLVENQSVEAVLPEQLSVVLARDADGVGGQHHIKLNAPLQNVKANLLALVLRPSVQKEIDLRAPFLNLPDPVVCRWARAARGEAVRHLQLEKGARERPRWAALLHGSRTVGRRGHNDEVRPGDARVAEVREEGDGLDSFALEQEKGGGGKRERSGGERERNAGVCQPPPTKTSLVASESDAANLPSPISSARMALMFWLCRNASQLRPIIWYGLSVHSLDKRQDTMRQR